MIYLNNVLVQPDKDKLKELESIFPSMFMSGVKFQPVRIRNNDAFMYKAKVGRTGGKMKMVDRPNAGVRIARKAIFVDENYRSNEIVVTNAPPKIDSKGNVDHGKNLGFTIEHGTTITTIDDLYFLYYYYGNISNNACPKKSGNPQFSFVMTELEQGQRIEGAKSDAKIIVAITETLSDVSVKDALTKLKVSSTDNAKENRDVLLGMFNGTSKANVSEVVTSILDVISESGSDIDVDVQEAVIAALEAGKIKIEEGKLFMLKSGTTEFSTKAEKKLDSEDADEQILEVVTYFGSNSKKLEQLIK